MKFHWKKQQQCRPWLVLFWEVTDSARNWRCILHGQWPLQISLKVEVFLNFSGGWNFRKSYWMLKEGFSVENHLNSPSLSSATWPGVLWKDSVFSARCRTKNSLRAPLGRFTLCLRALSEPKGFTSAVATCYSAYGVENNIMQKCPRSFLLSILPSSCCCAVFIPPDSRLLTLLRYPDLGMHPSHAVLM